MVTVVPFRGAVVLNALLLCFCPFLATGQSVAVYFGSGCFWGRQKDFVDVERKILGRTDEQVTALVGYAGGAPSGVKKACYYHAPHELVYENQGHAEVTQVELLPHTLDLEDQMGIFSAKFFTQFDHTSQGMRRTDPQDRGLGYRTLVGIPGGMKGKLYPIFSSKNVHKMNLIDGDGGEDDTINTVYVMDSDIFRFFPGEIYHQFHDGLGHSFPPDYTRSLRETQARVGRLKSTGCPEHGEDPQRRFFDDGF